MVALLNYVEKKGVSPLRELILIVREEMVVGRRMKRSSISFDETPYIVHPVITVT